MNKFNSKINGLSFSNPQACSFIQSQNKLGIFLPINVKQFREKIEQIRKKGEIEKTIDDSFPLLAKIEDIRRGLNRSIRPPPPGAVIARFFSTESRGVCFGMCWYVIYCWILGKNVYDQKLKDCWVDICLAQYGASTFLERLKNKIGTTLETNQSSLNQLWEEMNNKNIVILCLQGVQLSDLVKVSHAVVAFDLREEKRIGGYIIDIYDPNYPIKNKQILLDSSNKIISGDKIFLWEKLRVWNDRFFIF